MSKRFWTVLLVFVLALVIPLGIWEIWKAHKIMQEMEIFPPEVYVEEVSGEAILLANGTPIVIDSPDTDTSTWTLEEEMQELLGDIEEVGALVHWPKSFGSKEEWYVRVPENVTIVGGSEGRGVTIRTKIDMRGGTVGALLGGNLRVGTSENGMHIDISGGTVLYEISLIGVDSGSTGASRLRVTGGRIGLPDGEPAIVRLYRPSDMYSTAARQKMRYDIFGGEWNAIVNCDEVYLVHASGKPVFGENGVLILYDETGVTVQQQLDPDALIRVTSILNVLESGRKYEENDIGVGRKIAGPKLYRRDIIPATENYEAVELKRDSVVQRFSDCSQFVPLAENKTLGMLRDNAVRVLYASQLECEDGKLTVRYTDDSGKVHELPDQPYQTTYRNSKGEISSVRPKKGAYTQIITYEGDRLEWIAPGAVEIQID